jgi:outer membrane protein
VKKQILVIAIFFIAFSSIFAQQVNQKTGYVNLEKIYKQMPEAIKAQSDLDAIVSEWRQTIDDMTQDYQQRLQQYQQRADTMTQEELQAAQQELFQQEQEIMQYRQKKFSQPDGELYQKQEELMGPVNKKIKDAISQVAEEQGMDFVFDKSGDVILLHANKEYDITFKVLDKLK